MSIQGCATTAGTRRYAARLASLTAAGHFRQEQELCMSSIGLGTYLGHWDERTDRMYQEAIRRAVDLGCNVIDSAINYRFQRSERVIGAALNQLFEAKRAARDEVIIATKGGFIPFDNEPPRDPRAWIVENIIETGAAAANEIVGGSHCMTPSYLDNQLTRSLENLGLACLDVYYIHNPETQLQAVPRAEFNQRMRAAFAFLEEAVAAGRIRFYGTATWNGYRQPPAAPDYLSLSELVNIARDVAGNEHHFRVIQLPYNLAMPEAFTEANQVVDGEMLSPLMAAHRLGMTVMCSASMMQARLTAGLPAFIGATLKGLKTDGQRAIQFVRSTPGVTTALIGMSQRSHVEENLEVARVEPPSVEEFFQMFSSGE
jgi:aryl-alcohol dehydrogenase-like predicted oxidoreductase